MSNTPDPDKRTPDDANLASGKGNNAPHHDDGDHTHTTPSANNAAAQHSAHTPDANNGAGGAAAYRPSNLSFGAQDQSANSAYYDEDPDYDPIAEEDRPSRRPSELDYEADPLLRLERNNRSTRQAIMFFIGTIVLTSVTAFLIWMASAITGGPYCDADATAILCSSTYRLMFMIIPPAIAAFGLFGGAWIAYLKWKKHQRWRPWIAVIWFIMPFTLAWVISAGSMLIGH